MYTVCADMSTVSLHCWYLIIFHELTCCFGFGDFDVGLCGLHRLGFELRLHGSPHRAGADRREADVAAERTHLLAAC